MIKISGATKRYRQVADGPGLAVAALQGVSLEIATGEFIAIMGPSGCGKSTLLHLLGGLDRLSEGEIFLAGEALHRLDEAGLTRLRREKIGFIFQFFNLLPTLTVAENVELPAILQGKKAGAYTARARELLEQVGLGPRRDHRLHQLSGGEMQRAALARALLLNPPVLLADEPTGNLDSEASGRVVALFKSLGATHRTTIVMVTHSREIAQAAERIVEMRDGRVVGTETSDFGIPSGG